MSPSPHSSLPLSLSPHHISFPPQFLYIEEVTTCRYDAVVATRQLCRNKAYRCVLVDQSDRRTECVATRLNAIIAALFLVCRLKESPVHTINCFARENSPKYVTDPTSHLHPLIHTSARQFIPQSISCSYLCFPTEVHAELSVVPIYTWEL